MDWNDPTQRAALAERLGPAEYNKAVQQHLAASTVATVNGHAIRPVGSRFGQLYAVGRTGVAYRTQAEAEAYAKTIPAEKE